MDIDQRTVDATISIPNGVNVTVAITMTGFGSEMLKVLQTSDFLREILYEGQSAFPQSFTVVHVQNAYANITKSPVRHSSVGKRQAGDLLIYFCSKNVTNLSHFASKLFEFVGTEGDAITYVGFTFNVSEANFYFLTTADSFIVLVI